ncbi:unnamed protein product [Arctia plantaginis]|uniref:Uncharacterized protein n=1 Tax=Arctia plantaginis TaxID=874455 RepID=A0A8S0ZB23_ARCPL|nr:unnamed protein product [Arctia plantaginis]
MLQNWFYLLLAIGTVLSYPTLFETKKFKVGIEYDGSLPMKGGSDRYRHRNNYEPFFVTNTVEARKGFVITYLEITGIINANGELDFNVVRGSAGSTQLTFQLVSNNTDFLTYSYLSYGIREQEYKKLANIVTIPMTNEGSNLGINAYGIFVLIFSVMNIIINI